MTPRIIQLDGGLAAPGFVQNTLIPYATAALPRWRAEHPDHADPTLTLWADLLEQGSVRLPLYAEVARTLQRWQRQGIAAGVASPHPPELLDLLLRYTPNGDLRRTLPHRITVQSPDDPATWVGTGTLIAVDPAWLQAAAAAGWQTVHLRRGGGGEVSALDQVT